MEYEIILYLRGSILKWKYEVWIFFNKFFCWNWWWIRELGRYYVTKKKGHIKLHKDYVNNSHTLLHHICLIWTSTMKVHTAIKSQWFQAKLILNEVALWVPFQWLCCSLVVDSPKLTQKQFISQSKQIRVCRRCLVSGDPL
jgi:hypothetical protein